MKIEELFIKSISRPINGVIKADQSDTESIYQELDEYVVTRELDIHFRKFLESYLGTEQAAQASKNGVWISGFFGSGKSHFLKILSYVLANSTVTREGLTRQAIEFFDGKVTDPMLAADLRRAASMKTDVILFNVDSKADGHDEHAILKVFLRVFNEKRGFSSDYPHIAHLERYLASKGKLEAFHEAFKKRSGSNWLVERDAYQFHVDDTMAALGDAIGLSRADAEEWFEKFEADFKPTIENFARWVNDYIEASGVDRIVFLVDEVGAFIGQDTRLMTNLQTVVENLGTICKGRAWVVVTSQADMDAIIGDLRSSRANDFSKIQGRFRTRLSLSGAHANEVIQERLLKKKTDEIKGDLKALYAGKADVLRNQMTFRETGMTFKAYAGDEDFAAVYPFVPYQFQLVQKVFDASRAHGATGAHLAKGERSMLDAFQTAAMAVSEDQVGRLVPFYRFYPAIESFLEDIVRRAIKSVDDNPSLEPFDSDVLKTLFLIRYVDEIKGNVDNLVTLFIDEIDTDKLELRRKIEASLARLEKETLVNRNGDNFYFLTNEERDIAKEIGVVQTTSAEEIKLLNDIIYDDIIRTLNRGKFRHKTTGNDFEVGRFTDSHPYSSRVESDIVLNVVTPLGDDYDDYNDAKATLKSLDNDGQIIIRLDNDRDLAREVRRFLQTEKLIDRKSDGSQPETVRRILQDQSRENTERRQRVAVVIDRLLQTARVYAAGQHLSDASGSAQAIVDQALNYLIDNTFGKLNLIDHRVEDPRSEIPSALRDTVDGGLDLDGGEYNARALKEVRDYIALMTSASKQIVLHDLVGRFGRRPFGWGDWETVLLVARLVARGDISLAAGGETLARDRVWDELDGPNKWRRITVHLRKSVSKDTLHKVRDLSKEIFGKTGPDSEDGLAGYFRDNLTTWQADFAGWLQVAETGTYPGVPEMKDGGGVIRKALSIEDPAAFLEHLFALKDEFLDLFEDYSDLSGFYKNQRKAWDDLTKALARFRSNEAELVKDEAARKALDRIRAIQAMPAPYGAINEGAKLIAEIDEVNDRLVKARRDHALSKVDELIVKIQAELDRQHSRAELRNSALVPLQRLRKQIDAEASIAHIFQLQSQAPDAYDEAFDLIERESAVIVSPEGGASAPGGDETGQGGGATRRPSVPPRRRSIVRPAALVADDGFIETEAEARAFIAKLEGQLLEAIANGERIEIR
jgi:hypothetical protein